MLNAMAITNRVSGSTPSGPPAPPNISDILDENAVLHASAQDLSDEAQLQALENLGITFPGDDVMQIERAGRALTVRLSSTD